MKRELEEKLMQDFSFMIARNIWTGEILDFPVGCSCGDGWFNLIYKLCFDIQKVLDKESIEFYKGFYPIQIKEKYASLRFYTTYGNDEIIKLIDEAESKSETICETCGSAGTVKESGSWFKTLCPKCANEQGYKDFKDKKDRI